MSELTFGQVEEKVRELVAANPEFIYNRGDHTGCLYNPDEEQPGCLFGQALIALGVKLPEELEGKGIDDVFLALDVDLTDLERDWANWLQIEQDSGRPWGQALELIDKKFPLR